MASYSVGTAGESVAQIQRWLLYWSRRLGIKRPAGFLANGTFDANTAALLRAVQTKMKLPATGAWDARTIKHSQALGKMFKSSEFGYLPKANSIAEDRIYVTQQFQYLYDRPPTATELNFRVHQLQGGMGHVEWMAQMEKIGAGDSVKRIFKEVYGRDATVTEINQWSAMLRNGQQTRKSMEAYLASTPEGITHKNTTAPSPESDDQKVALEKLLDEYGLGTLKDWAWDQIKSGVSETRIIQNLRETEEYKKRFAGMAGLGGAGRPAMSEADYLAYEKRTAELMRRYGLPPSFYDGPEDFAALISNGVSPEEVEARITQGYDRVVNAPIEIRQAFSELYGTDGDSALAALFIDPDKAEQALLKQTRAAEAKGWGGLFGIDFSLGQAEDLAGIDVSTDELRQGFGQIQQMDPLFSETVNDATDLRADTEGVEAVFGTGGDGANKLDKRRRERIAAMAGGGGANISQEGIGLGAAE